MNSTEPNYQRLTTACAAYGIKRGHAYKLMRLGLIETFKIGKTRYVYLESLRTLPMRVGPEWAKARSTGEAA